MKKIFLAIFCLGCVFLNFNCAQMTTGLERELTMRAETEREFALWWKDIRENPTEHSVEDRAFAERVFRIHRQTQSFPWEHVRRYFDDKNLPAPSNTNTPTPATPHAEYKGTYYNSARDVYHLTEDTDGHIEVSENGAEFIAHFLNDTGSSTEREMGKKLYKQKLELLKKELQ